MDLEVRRFLTELEESGRIHDARESDHARKFLNLEPLTAEIVSILVRGVGASRVLEVGTSNGYSTIWLADAMKSTNGTVVSIDRNPEKHVLARENLLRVGLLERVELHCGDATEIVAALPGPFDAVFFDADRISAPEQLTLILAKLSPAALVLADNALSHPLEIDDYLQRLKSLQQVRHVVIPVGKGLSVAFVGLRQ